MKIVDNKLKFSTLTKRKTTNRCIFHHSAGNGSVEQIHQIHKNNGWSGIGYHLYVRTDGTIYQGRPINMIGAHASNNNYDSIGVCFEGNFETSNMTDKQIEAGKEIVAYLKNKYKNIYFQKHKDVSSTACPGKNFKFDAIVETPCCGKSYLYDKYPNLFFDVDELRLRIKYHIPQNITRKELEESKGNKSF